MRLLNSPWKKAEDSDQIVIVDSKDFQVVSLELDEDFLPGTLADEQLKARAIQRLPEIMEQLGYLHDGNETENADKVDLALANLLALYELVRSGT